MDLVSTYPPPTALSSLDQVYHFYYSKLQRYCYEDSSIGSESRWGFLCRPMWMRQFSHNHAILLQHPVW